MTSFNNDNESLNEAYVRQCLGEDYEGFEYEGRYITVEEFLKLQLDTGMIYEIEVSRGEHFLSATNYTNTLFQFLSFSFYNNNIVPFI